MTWEDLGTELLAAIQSPGKAGRTDVGSRQATWWAKNSQKAEV